MGYVGHRRWGLSRCSGCEYVISSVLRAAKSFSSRGVKLRKGSYEAVSSSQKLMYGIF